MSNNFGFTKEHFDKYRNTKKKIHNSKLRSPNESFADAMCSEEADFSKTAEGKEVLELIKKIGDTDAK